MDIAEAPFAIRQFGFLLANLIQTQCALAGLAAREDAVMLFMLPQAPPEQLPVPGRVTQRSGKLAGSVRASRPTIDGDLSSGGAVFTFGLEAGGSGIDYAAIQEFGGGTRAHIIRPKNARALAWQGPNGPRFALSVNHPGSHLPPRPYMGPAMARQAELIPLAIEAGAQEIADRLFS